MTMTVPEPEQIEKTPTTEESHPNIKDGNVDEPPMMEVSRVNSDEEDDSMTSKSSSETEGIKKETIKSSQFTVNVSIRFFFMSILASIFIAFAAGRTAHYFLVVKTRRVLVNLNRGEESPKENDKFKLPSPVMKDGKVPPQTVYTAKNFDTARSVSIQSRFIVSDEGKECDAAATTQGQSTEGDSPADDEIHEPKGQHLLVDIANVDSEFLNSEEKLATAMLELVRQCGLTLLSYHCHGLEPSGVSCAGVLLESHVSFHTWPAEGVIILDLFTCGPGSLLPFVSITKNLFAIPSSVTNEQAEVIWSHKFRGFSANIADEIAVRTDFFKFPIGMMTDYKEQVVSAQTDFQRVDIYDVLRPHFQSIEAYKKSQEYDGSYESQNPEYFEPDRIVFLDGILQSRRSGDSAYHESLVHPGMFSHPNPKHVAIIGGGEGATLREVLKHKTVEKVVMIEIDEKMVNLSREHLPFWSDCSSLVGSTENCFDDPRVDANYVDAFKWFIDRYSGDGEITAELFDVIIMDAL
jgi:spermidine synthase